MIFENTFGELVDVLIENDDKSFSFTTSGQDFDYTKIGEFMAKDVFDILMKEKTGLNDYDSIKVVRIIESFYNDKGSLPVKYHQVHISCNYDGFAVTGSERIEDLPQKVRQIKLEKILG